jgi:hypothetical protein
VVYQLVSALLSLRKQQWPMTLPIFEKWTLIVVEHEKSPSPIFEKPIKTLEYYPTIV